MSSILRGNKINVSVFGQSHSEAIGCVIDGLPAGVKLDTLSISLASNPQYTKSFRGAQGLSKPYSN